MEKHAWIRAQLREFSLSAPVGQTGSRETQNVTLEVILCSPFWSPSRRYMF